MSGSEGNCIRSCSTSATPASSRIIGSITPRSTGRLRIVSTASFQVLAIANAFGYALVASRARGFVANPRAIGIVNKVVPAADLAAFVRERAAALAAKPAGALRNTKQLLRYSATASVSERMTEEGALFGAALQSDEAREAMTAFMEKRAPDFSRFG